MDVFGLLFPTNLHLFLQRNFFFNPVSEDFQNTNTVLFI